MREEDRRRTKGERERKQRKKNLKRLIQAFGCSLGFLMRQKTRCRYTRTSKIRERASKRIITSSWKKYILIIIKEIISQTEGQTDDTAARISENISDNSVYVIIKNTQLLHNGTHESQEEKIIIGSD